MYKVVMYEDARGYSPVEEFIYELDQKAARNKSARIQLKQTTFCLDLLQKIGTRAGENYVKHVKGDIWELRPGSNRILFFAWRGNTLVMLHPFRKTTNKTPHCEIERAERELNDWVNRHGQ